jgi:hypothetical protein
MLLVRNMTFAPTLQETVDGKLGSLIASQCVVAAWLGDLRLVVCD